MGWPSRASIPGVHVRNRWNVWVPKCPVPAALRWGTLRGRREGAVLIKIAAVVGTLIWLALTVWMLAHGVEPV